MRSGYQTAQQGTTDTSGNVTFTFPQNGAGNLVNVATFAILEASVSGTFVASVDSTNKWGPWSGSQPFGPITYAANNTMQIVCTGLLPSAVYTCQLIGWSDYEDQVDPSIPIPTGTTALYGTDGIFDEFSLAVPATTLVRRRYYPCSSWAGVRLFAQSLTAGPIQVALVWYNAGENLQMGQRVYLLGPGGVVPGFQLQPTTPHLGDFLEVQFQNFTATPATIAAAVTHTSQPVATFGGLDYVVATAFAIAASPAAAVAVLSPQYIYGGPATIDFDPGSISANYDMHIEAMNTAGTWVIIYQRTNADTTKRVHDQLLIPASPIRVTCSSSGGAGAVAATLTYDLHRVG